jgi:16S rRNA (adenine1518-N6/adenine1519-N6)-dimethyltransferase
MKHNPLPGRHVEGIPIKKQFGQHFLRDQQVIDTMIGSVDLTPESSVFEIGCGDGFLTRSILNNLCTRLRVFEIDPDWAAYVTEHYPDPRLEMVTENILDVNFPEQFVSHQPWVLLANLPYQITFPLLFKLQKYRSFLQEGVIMVQDEVAHKLLKSSGRDYGFVSLFFQHYFTWKSLVKIPPAAFFPPPKVNSRLLHFIPRIVTTPIPHEEEFWKFVKSCFAQPRRNLKNNLKTIFFQYQRPQPDTPYDNLRAQQMNFEQFLNVWNKIYEPHP